MKRAAPSRKDGQTPTDRINVWPDDMTHRVRLSARMIEELYLYGMTTTAGSSLFGPELLVLELHPNADFESVADLETRDADE